MQLGTVMVGGRPSVVIATPTTALVDVRATGHEMDADSPWLDASVRELIAGGHEAQEFLDRIRTGGASVRTVSEAYDYLPPVLDPPRIFCVGRNYEEHAREGNAEVPDFPMIFLKPATALLGHDRTVSVPGSTQKVDWEGEIAVVVGRGGRDISEDCAWEHVYGLTVANDLTARDWQRRTSQFDAGKMFDGFGPLGPVLTTLDEVEDVGTLRVTTHVNGELMQSGSVTEMVFPIPHLVAYLSQAVTLLPGDVILTGTPSGVGYARTPPVFLEHGDTVEVAVEGLGRLRNRIRHEARAEAL